MTSIELKNSIIKKNRISTRVRIVNIILLVFVLIILSISTSVIVSGISGGASENLARLYSLEAVGKFSALLNQELVLIEKVARSRAVTSWFNDEENSEKKSAAFDEIMDYAGILQNATIYFVIHRSLNEFAIEPGEALDDFVSFDRIIPSIPENYWYIESITSKEKFTLNIGVDKVTGEKQLWINYKVMDGNSVLGLFCSGIHFDEVIDNFLIHYNARNVKGYVIDNRGIIHMDSTDPEFNPENNTKHIREESSDPAFRSGVESYLTGIYYLLDLDAEPVVIKLKDGAYGYASIAPIGATDWSVVTFFNTETLFSTYNLLPLLAALLSAFLLYTLVNNGLIQRLFLVPLNNLTEDLSQSKPNTGDIYGYNRADEIGDLARTVQDMRDRLSVYNADIINATRELERHDQLLYAVNRTAAVLLASDIEEKFESSLRMGMELMAQCMDINRVYIWKNETVYNTLRYVQLYDWMDDIGKNSNPVPYKASYPYSDNPQWLEFFLKDECINGPLSSMPEHTRKLLEACKVKSLLLIPVHLHEEFWGFVNFDDCSRERIFTKEEVDILRSGSLMMVSAIQRNNQAKKIQEAHERTQQLVDATPLASNLWDKNYQVTFCNEESVRLFDLNSKEEYLHRFWDLSPEYQPDGELSYDKAMRCMKHAFENGRDQLEWMHQKLDGTPIPVEVTLVRIKYDNEYRLAGYSRDIRTHKQMMDGIEQRDNMLQTINRVAAILLQSDIDDFINTLWVCMGMMADVVNVDRVYIWKNSTKEGRLYCTQLYEWSLGADPQQGNKLTVEIPYDENIPSWEQILSSGKCINSLVKDMSEEEKAQLSPQGILSILVVPVFLQDQFWGFVGFDDCHRERIFSESEESILRSGSLLISNALLRNEMTLNIRDAAARLEAVISNYSGVIWSVNRENIITLFNGLYLNKMGIKPSYIEGKSLEHARQKFHFFDILERVKKTFIEGPQDWHSDIDGKIFRAHTTPIFDESGSAASIVGSLDDITELIRLQTELKSALEKAQAASQAKSNFLSNMSHEIRTPMNAIIGMTAIGKSGLTLEKKDYAFEKIEGASKHLLGIINDILEMSKIEAGKFDLSFVEFNFEKMIQKAVNVISFKVEEKQQKLSLYYDKDIPQYLIGDDQRLTQVITNLISNAVKFTPEEGSIELAAYLVKEEDGIITLKFKVSDTGIGISPEQQERLFTSFEQAESSTSRKFGGTGLGLSISKNIVELMNGSIWVESKLGAGASFFFTIQLRQVERKENADLLSGGANKFVEQTDSEEDGSTELEDVFPGRCLLLAEDVEINREIVLTMLEPFKLEIECAVNGKEAVEMFKAEPGRYDLIFMDLQMPEMDGLEATRQIRAIETQNNDDNLRRQIPIIAMTANVFKEDIEKCIESGMDDHLGKPLDFAEVLNKLKAYLT